MNCGKNWHSVKLCKTTVIYHKKFVNIFVNWDVTEVLSGRFYKAGFFMIVGMYFYNKKITIFEQCAAKCTNWIVTKILNLLTQQYSSEFIILRTANIFMHFRFLGMVHLQDNVQYVRHVQLNVNISSSYW